MPRDRCIRFSLVALVLWILMPIVAIAAAGVVYAWHAGRNATARELMSHVQALAAGVGRELDVPKAALQTPVDVPVELDGRVAYGLTMAFTPSAFTAVLNERESVPDGWRALVVDAST